MFHSCASCGILFSCSQLPWQLEVHIRAERWRDTRWRSCRCLPELRCQCHPSLQRQRQRQQPWHCQVQGKDSHRNVTGCVALIRILSLAQDTYNPGLRNSPCWWRLSELGWGGGAVWRGDLFRGVVECVFGCRYVFWGKTTMSASCRADIRRSFLYSVQWKWVRVIKRTFRWRSVVFFHSVISLVLTPSSSLKWYLCRRKS